MVPKPNSLIIVSILEEHSENSEFERTHWPPHTTIIPWFSFEDQDKLVKTISQVASMQNDFSTVLGAHESFGPNLDIPVNVYSNQIAFEKVHKRLYEALTGLGVDFQERQWMGNKYRAHVTRLEARQHQLEEGDKITVNNFTLAQLTSPTRCKIIRIFKFGNKS